MKKLKQKASNMLPFLFILAISILFIICYYSKLVESEMNEVESSYVTASEINDSMCDGLIIKKDTYQAWNFSHENILNKKITISIKINKVTNDNIIGTAVTDKISIKDFKPSVVNFIIENNKSPTKIKTGETKEIVFIGTDYNSETCTIKGFLAN